MTAAVTETSAAVATKPATPPLVPDHGGAIDVFASAGNFGVAQRMATALATSTLVPKDYQGNLANVLIALELASRIGASVFAVMQNIDIIHGRPAWRATFLIATVNACGRFTPLRFRFQGTEGKADWGCRAVAKDRETGEECLGTLITIALANAEGWTGKNGSKWKTMPEQMLCYRAAAFWTRVYAPELSLGMQTGDEVHDVHGDVGSIDVPASMVDAAKSLEAQLLGVVQNAGVAAGAKPRLEVEVDPLTGEIVPPAREPGDD